jgi:hypothetical protein
MEAPMPILWLYLPIIIVGGMLRVALAERAADNEDPERIERLRHAPH